MIHPPPWRWSRLKPDLAIRRSAPGSIRWTRPPIPVTVTTLALLIIGPAIGLRQLPRPRAQGLEQLMASASLLQSFEATPDRPVPRLWQMRFGVPLAERLWTQQRHVWWQFWGGHVESDPYLAIPASSLVSLPESEQPPGSIRVDDLLVVPPDPLSRQLLLDRLQPELRPSRGLERHCLKVLEGGQAVFWNPAAVGVITGLLAPFLQRYQEGCLTLELDAGGLLWQGESASVEGLLVEVTPAAAEPLPRSTTEGPEPLPQDLLLEIRGSSLQQLFEGLLSREVIREPLAAVYGIDQKRMAWLKPVPFRLRLRARQKGPFLASIELQIPTGAAKPQWDELLDDLAEVLRKRDLRDLSPTEAEEAGASPRPARDLQGTTWSRPDGVEVGGWQWIRPAQGPPELLLHVGPRPTIPLALAAQTIPKLNPGEMRLRARPAAMESLGLLPEEMPPVVKQSAQLWMHVVPSRDAGGEESVSRLKGGLQMAQP